MEIFNKLLIMLLTQSTEVFLIQKWRRGAAIKAQEKVTESLLIAIALGLIAYTFYYFKISSALMVSCLFFSCFYVFLFFICICQLKNFEADNSRIYQRLNPLFSQRKLEDFEKLAFAALVSQAEHCLWQQTHNPHDHQSISDRQIEFKGLYVLCEKFQLLHESCAGSGYKIYFDEAKKNPEISKG